jgi:hypothetical protein
MDDIASGACQYIAQSAAIISLLGSVPESDPNPVNVGVPFLWRETPLFTLTGTGQAMIVCSNAGSWGAPVAGSTARFPRLSVELYVDPLRDAALNWTDLTGNTVRRLEQLFAIVHGYLQRRDPAPIIWGDLCTVGCTLLAEGTTTQWSDTDGVQYKQCFYGCTTSGWTDVSV